MPQDNPPLLDKTMNTTESTPRNLADVLASGLANIANNVKPDGSDISISVPGMDANNVNDGFSELKQSLDDTQTAMGNMRCVHYFNTSTITIDVGFTPSTAKSASGFLYSPNQGVCLLLKLDTTPTIHVISSGSKTFTITLSGSTYTITSSDTLWGLTTVILDNN